MHLLYNAAVRTVDGHRTFVQVVHRDTCRYAKGALRLNWRQLDEIARRGFDPRPDEEDRMPMRGEGISGHVIRTGEAVIVPDVSRDPRYIAGRRKTRSEIAVPIIQDGQIIRRWGEWDITDHRSGN